MSHAQLVVLKEQDTLQRGYRFNEQCSLLVALLNINLAELNFK